MQVRIHRDGNPVRALPLQSATSVTLSAWADTDAPDSIALSVREQPDGRLAYTISVMGATGMLIHGSTEGVALPELVPDATPPPSSPHRATSDDSGALTDLAGTVVHRYARVNMSDRCAACGLDWTAEIHEDPSLLTDHPVRPVEDEVTTIGHRRITMTRCGDCPPDAPVALRYHLFYQRDPSTT